MCIQLWRNALSYCNLCSYVKVSKLWCMSAKLYSTKQYRMKNKFTFKEDLKKVGLKNYKSETSFVESFSKKYEFHKENINSSLTDGFVSADLLSQAKSQTTQKNV